MLFFFLQRNWESKRKNTKWYSEKTWTIYVSPSSIPSLLLIFTIVCIFEQEKKPLSAEYFYVCQLRSLGQYTKSMKNTCRLHASAFLWQLMTAETIWLKLLPSEVFIVLKIKWYQGLFQYSILFSYIILCMAYARDDSKVKLWAISV